MFKRFILVLFLAFAVVFVSYAASDLVVPGMGEFDRLAAEGAGLPTSNKNPPRQMDAGLA